MFEHKRSPQSLNPADFKGKKEIRVEKPTWVSLMKETYRKKNLPQALYPKDKKEDSNKIKKQNAERRKLYETQFNKLIDKIHAWAKASHATDQLPVLNDYKKKFYEVSVNQDSEYYERYIRNLELFSNALYDKTLKQGRREHALAIACHGMEVCDLGSPVDLEKAMLMLNKRVAIDAWLGEKLSEIIDNLTDEFNKERNVYVGDDIHTHNHIVKYAKAMGFATLEDEVKDTFEISYFKRYDPERTKLKNHAKKIRREFTFEEKLEVITLNFLSLLKTKYVYASQWAEWTAAATDIERELLKVLGLENISGGFEHKGDPLQQRFSPREFKQSLLQYCYQNRNNKDFPHKQIQLAEEKWVKPAIFEKYQLYHVAGYPQYAWIEDKADGQRYALDDKEIPVEELTKYFEYCLVYHQCLDFFRLSSRLDLTLVNCFPDEKQFSDIVKKIETKIEYFAGEFLDVLRSDKPELFTLALKQLSQENRVKLFEAMNIDFIILNTEHPLHSILLKVSDDGLKSDIEYLEGMKRYCISSWQSDQKSDFKQDLSFFQLLKNARTADSKVQLIYKAWITEYQPTNLSIVKRGNYSHVFLEANKDCMKDSSFVVAYDRDTEKKYAELKKIAEKKKSSKEGLLACAAQLNQIEEAKEILKNSDIDVTEALCEAVYQGHIEMVRLLLPYYENINYVNEEEVSLIDYSITAGSLGMVKFLISQQASLYLTPDTLHIAIRNNASIEIIQYLLASGASPLVEVEGKIPRQLTSDKKIQQLLKVYEVFEKIKIGEIDQQEVVSENAIFERFILRHAEEVAWIENKESKERIDFDDLPKEEQERYFNFSLSTYNRLDKFNLSFRNDLSFITCFPDEKKLTEVVIDLAKRDKLYAHADEFLDMLRNNNKSRFVAALGCLDEKSREKLWTDMRADMIGINPSDPLYGRLQETLQTALYENDKVYEWMTNRLHSFAKQCDEFKRLARIESKESKESKNQIISPIDLFSQSHNAREKLQDFYKVWLSYYFPEYDHRNGIKDYVQQFKLAFQKNVMQIADQQDRENLLNLIRNNISLDCFRSVLRKFDAAGFPFSRWAIQCGHTHYFDRCFEIDMKQVESYDPRFLPLAVCILRQGKILDTILASGPVDNMQSGSINLMLLNAITANDRDAIQKLIALGVQLDRKNQIELVTLSIYIKDLNTIKFLTEYYIDVDQDFFLSILPVMVEIGQPDVVRYFFDSVILSKNKNVTDSIYSMAALAAENGSWDVAKILLDYLKIPISEFSEKMMPVAVEENRWLLVKFLIEKNPHILISKPEKFVSASYVFAPDPDVRNLARRIAIKSFLSSERKEHKQDAESKEIKTHARLLSVGYQLVQFDVSPSHAQAVKSLAKHVAWVEHKEKKEIIKFSELPREVQIDYFDFSLRTHAAFDYYGLTNGLTHSLKDFPPKQLISVLQTLEEQKRIPDIVTELVELKNSGEEKLFSQVASALKPESLKLIGAQEEQWYKNINYYMGPGDHTESFFPDSKESAIKFFSAKQHFDEKWHICLEGHRYVPNLDSPDLQRLVSLNDPKILKSFFEGRPRSANATRHEMEQLSLLFAITFKQYDAINDLIAKNPSLISEVNQFGSPLQCAITLRDLPMLKYLLSQGFRVRIDDIPLPSDPNILKFMCEQGLCDMQAKTQAFVRARDINYAKMIVEEGIDPELFKALGCESFLTKKPRNVLNPLQEISAMSEELIKLHSSLGRKWPKNGYECGPEEKDIAYRMKRNKFYLIIQLDQMLSEEKENSSKISKTPGTVFQKSSSQISSACFVFKTLLENDRQGLEDFYKIKKACPILSNHSQLSQLMKKAEVIFKYESKQVKKVASPSSGERKVERK